MSDPCQYIVARDIRSRCGADCAEGWDVCPDHLDDAGIDPDYLYDRERDES